MDYLRKIPVFAELADEFLKLIHRHIIERSYNKGMIIFLEGEPGEGFHFVISGKVKIVKTTDDGREHTIKIMNPGEIFAEVLLFHEQHYPATAVAAENSRVGMIKNSDLEKLILANNRLALHLIKALSQRLIYAQTKIKNLALTDVLSRTAHALLNLGREHGRLTAQGTIEIPLDMPRQELANLVGTTRETVTRTLSALKKDQIINFDGRRLIILQPDKLANYIE